MGNLSEHFNKSEFACRCGNKNCKNKVVDAELVGYLERLRTELGATACIVSSGYRCPLHSLTKRSPNSQHAKAKAADVSFKGTDGKFIDGKAVCVVAQNMGVFGGIALNQSSNGASVHLDIRKPVHAYIGDENINYKNNITGMKFLNESRFANAYNAYLIKYGKPAKPTNPYPATNATLRVGDKGDKVKWVQWYLGVTEDGIFGKKTEQAVKSYQTAHGLKADGIVGAKTKTTMRGN
jgi:hypothetical protein